MATIKNNKISWQLPRSRTDLEAPFNFKVYNFRNDGLYFIGFNLAIPLVILLITSLVLDRTSTAFSLINLLTSFACLTFSFFYLNMKSTQTLVRSGLFIFYAFILIPNIIVFLFQLLLSVAAVKSQWTTIVQLWAQALGEIIVIVLAFKWTTNLKNRVRWTFKFSWKWLLVILVVGVGLMWGASLLYNLIFQNTPLAGDTNNQNSLVDILKHPDSPTIKAFYIFTLLMFTVGIAPLAEELACRHAWTIGSGNQLAEFISAPIFFGYLHVQSGDVEHILSYVLSGLILTSVFNYSRGNVVYSWMVHLGFNLLVLILLLV